MADTARSLSSLQTLLADNTAGDISPQDLRDFLVTALGVYGSINYEEHVSGASQSSLGTTPAKMTAFANNGNSNGTTPAAASDQITVNVAGNYDITFSVSFSGTASADFIFHLRKNGSEFSSPALCVRRKLGSTGDVGSAGATWHGVTLAASDVLTIYVETDDGGGGDSMTVYSTGLGVKMVG